MSSEIEINLNEKEGSIHVNNGNYFLSTLSALPQEHNMSIFWDL